MHPRFLSIPTRGDPGHTLLSTAAAHLPRRSTVLTVLRVCLAAVYLWFGSLKLAGVSSVNALVQATLPWPAPGWLVPAMGALEIGIGAAFLWGRLLLLLLPLFVGHMAATFSVLVMAPQLAFSHGNPLVLTFTGEFVVKNLVLLSAGVLVALDPDSGVAPVPVAEPVRIPVESGSRDKA